eukprot:m.145634 g.145634  ORF g.145634 m.145634 type:complete len:102 (-) comp15025_c0_seq1:382-687(-)
MTRVRPLCSAQAAKQRIVLNVMQQPTCVRERATRASRWTSAQPCALFTMRKQDFSVLKTIGWHVLPVSLPFLREIATRTTTTLSPLRRLQLLLAGTWNCFL